MSDREGRYFETYIGDGAYVYFSEYREVVLYTSDGVTEKNRVVLEPQVLSAFRQWLAALEEATQRLIQERKADAP